MGHIINPIAFRLGHSRSWEDNWYIKNIYYPEFLHSMLKIRHYLYYFWTTRNIEKKGFILSHFNFFKFLKKLLVKIFLYNIDFEKHIYSFFAKGMSMFSDAFKARLKFKKKRKYPFFFERHKPDLFFLFYFYFTFFLYRRKRLKKKVKKTIYSRLYKKRVIENFNKIYLDDLKNNNLNRYLKNVKKKQLNNEFLKIEKYEEKIKILKNGDLNFGFFDFLVYTFFKVNMLEKPEEMSKKIKKRNYEQVLNYEFKIRQWIKLLKKSLVTRYKFRTKKKRSIKNFIFFLTFIVKLLKTIKKKNGRIIYKLRDLNLKLVRLIFLNKLLSHFGRFYGSFLKLIIYLLSNINRPILKFCFITNNSINARFLARYIGLKLKRKFPLFSVINPVKRELKKLYKRKKEKKSNLIRAFYDSKFGLNEKILNYKDSFKNIILHFSEKYIEFYNFYYYNYNSLITFDFLIFFFFLKKKLKNFKIIKIIKKTFFERYREKRFKKRKFYIKKKWIYFFKLIISKIKIFNIDYLIIINSFLKNNLFINLFFSGNRNNIDNLASAFFLLKFDINTFLFINKNFIFFLVYKIFFNFTHLNINSLFVLNSKYTMISNYFLRSFMYYLYTYYSFNNFIEAFNINNRKIFKKTKELYKSNSFILGFKMSFKGRFTRKQRASSIWFHQGIVPLNTVKGVVDYAFFTVPLKNSAVSIKLWIYKRNNKMIWNNKVINKK